MTDGILESETVVPSSVTAAVPQSVSSGDVQTPTEKMLPQSKMDEVVKLAKRDAELKGYERAQREHQARQSSATTDATTSIGGMIQLTPEQLEQKIYETANKLATQNMANKIEHDFFSKVDEAQKNDPEFAKNFAKLNIEQHPELILWTHQMENSTSVLKELAQNPSKMANVMMLAKSGFGEMAQDELNRLSASIKSNTDAKQQQPQINAPLDHLKASTAVSTDSGAMTVSDFRKMFRG